MFRLSDTRAVRRARVHACSIKANVIGRSVLIFAVATSGMTLSACASHATRTNRAAVSVATERDEAPVVLEKNQKANKAFPDTCHRTGLMPAIAFESGSSELISCAMRALDDDIKSLLDHPDLRVEVAGHTDSAESGAHSKALSLQRAKVVYDYLIAHGVPASMLIGPTGYGSERLLYVDTKSDRSDVDQEAAKSNRRVELNVQN